VASSVSHGACAGRDERASYTIEGIVAIGIFFLLLALIVQISFLILARSAAATSIEASLRRAVVSDVDDVTMASRIERDVAAVVPGAQDVAVDVTRVEDAVTAVVTFRWVPPGPDFVPVTVSIERSFVRVVPP